MLKRHAISGLCLAITASAVQAEDLLEIYRIALENDAQFQADDAAMKVDKQALPIAWAGLLPTLAGTASTSRTRTAYDGPITAQYPVTLHSHSDAYGLSLNQPVFHLDRFFNVRQARDVAKQAEASYVAATQNLILRVSTAYFDVLSAEDALHFTSAQKKAFARQLEQTQQRFDVGLIAITDVHEARARYDDAVAQEIAASNAVDDSFESLTEITGTPVHELAKLKNDFKLEKPVPLKMEAWVAQAQVDNAHLRAAQFASKAAKEQYRAAQSQHLPTVDFNGTYGRTHTGVSAVDSNAPAPDVTELEAFASPGTLLNETAQLSVSMPIFQGGGTYAAAKKAGYAFEQAKHHYDLTHRATVSQTRQAFRGVTTQISQVEALKQAVISNRSALKATTAAYEVGTRTIVDVLNSQSDLFNAEKAYAQSRYHYIQETFKLKLAAGRLAPEDVIHINASLAYDVSYEDKEG